MTIVRLLLLLLVSSGCTSHAKPKTCGRKFCLPPKAEIISSRSPIEDFILYEVEWNGSSISIYEGNHPSRGKVALKQLVTPIDRNAQFYESDGKANVIIEVGGQWPQYIQVKSECDPVQNCSAIKLAGQLKPR